MGYYIDLETISLDKYREKLKTAYLPPGRMILKEDIPERFEHFKSFGIKNVYELIHTLKKKDSIAELSKIKCLSGNYLTILLRELNSMLPKPNKLKDFEGISSESVSKLEKAGIKNTVKLFDKVKNPTARNELSNQTGIEECEMLELTKLTDLSRIKWVGTTFARMLYDIGIDTVEKASKADPVELHKEINRINKERNYYKGKIGLNDMKIFVNAANDVPQEIEY